MQHDVPLQYVSAGPVDNDAVKHIEAKVHKMDDILQTTFSNSHSCMKIVVFSFKFCWRGPIHYEPALAQIIAWLQIGEKSLFEARIV